MLNKLINKIKNRKKIFIGLVLFLVFFIGLVLFLTPEDVDDENIRRIEEDPERTNIPDTFGYRSIETEPYNNGYVLVKNMHDGYSIVVPEEWFVPEETYPNTMLGIYFSSTEEGHDHEHSDNGHAHTDEGLSLTISIIQNSENYNLIDWLARTQRGQAYRQNKELEEVVVGQETAFRSSFPLIDEGYDASRDEMIEIPIENTLNIEYILQGPSGDFFVLNCLAQGELFEEYIEPCKNQVQTFEFF